MTNYKIYNDNCVEVMKTMEAESVHNIITDPPWNIDFLSSNGFNDKIDNYVEWTREWAEEAYRIAKPGSFLLCLASTRQYHKVVTGIEQAGFEIKDTISHIFASGFPKSHKLPDNKLSKEQQEKWKGYQTPQLKPAQVLVCVAQKKREGTYANNMLKYKVGCFNIDATRIGSENINSHNYEGNHCHRPPEETKKPVYKDTQGRFPANVVFDDEAGKELDLQSGNRKGWSSKNHNSFNPYGGNSLNPSKTEREGEYKGFDDGGGASRFFKNTGEKEPYVYKDKEYNVEGFINKIKPNAPSNYNDGGKEGGASRFFFCSKASQKEKNAGLDNFEAKPLTGRDENQDNLESPFKNRQGKKKEHVNKGSRDYNARCKSCKKKFIGSPDTICSCDNPQTDNSVYKMKNNHPTIQSMNFFSYIIKLVAAPGTTILDPFLGSGTTLCAAANINNDYNLIGIEMNKEYSEIAEARIKHWIKVNKTNNEIIFQERE